MKCSNIQSFIILILLLRPMTLSSQDLVPFRVDSLWGYSSLDGKIKIPIRYEKAGIFYEKRAVVKKNGYYGYINPKGKIIVNFNLTQASSFNGYGIAQVAVNDSIFCIDVKGKPAPCYIYCGGPIINYAKFPVFEIDGELLYFPKKSIIDSNNRTNDLKTQGYKIDSLVSLSSGLAKAKNNSLWGLIDTMANELTPFVYDDLYLISEKSDKYIITVKDGLQGIISNNGKEIIPPKYNKIKEQYEYVFYAILPNGKSTYVSYNGKEFYKNTQ